MSRRIVFLVFLIAMLVCFSFASVTRVAVSGEVVFIGSADNRVYAFKTQYVSEFATMIASFLTWTILAIAVAYAKKRMERQVFAESTGRI